MVITPFGAVSSFESRLGRSYPPFIIAFPFNWKARHMCSLSVN